ncbi:MAG TPA: hypothetical protein PLE85_04435 [Bacteroidales bacterium]|nr:hypothetical protein [Bacteroidales bacterium]
MKVQEMMDLVGGKLVCGESVHNQDIYYGFASDLMSDVLTLHASQHLLITGLANLQTVRTAEMADIGVVLLVRGKKASPEMCELANDLGITIIETSFSMFRTSGLLFTHGLQPVY